MSFNPTNEKQYANKNSFLNLIANHLKMDGNPKKNRAKIITMIQGAKEVCELRKFDDDYKYSGIVSTNMLETVYLLVMVDEVSTYGQFIGWLHADPEWKNRN